MFNILISGSYNAFREGWNGAGIYMFSGLYVSETFKHPIYIGSTINFQKRIECEHINSLNTNKHPHNLPLQYAWNKHGPEKFIIWCLQVCDPTNIITIEQEYLDLYRPFADEFGGFNLNHYASGGGKPHSPESKEKIRKANIERFLKTNKRKFTVISPDNITFEGENIAQFCRDHDLNCSNFHLMLNGKKKSCKGWRLPETLVWGKRTFTIKSPNGEIITGNNVNKFCKENNLNQANFSSMLDGKHKHCKGWTLPESDMSENPKKGRNISKYKKEHNQKEIS